VISLVLLAADKPRLLFSKELIQAGIFRYKREKANDFSLLGLKNRIAYRKWFFRVIDLIDEVLISLV